jgi:hypothetical protein
MTILEDLQEDKAACRVEDLQAEVIELCLAQHNLMKRGS